MAFLSPAPSVMVVFSASILTFLARPRSRQLDVLQLDAQVLEDRLAAGQGGDVFQHGLAAIAVARGLDGADLQDALELVDHQRGQGIAFDVLGDDEQRLFLLGNRFQQRNQVLGGADLLLVDEDVGVLQLDQSSSSWLVTKCGDR